METERKFLKEISSAVEKYGVKHVFSYEITDSTNTRAKIFAKGEEGKGRADAIFLARAQSAGRGTHGRSFESPDGGGLYISFLFHPELSVCDCGKITVYAATRLLRAIERHRGNSAAEIGIKWVNDIYADGKKISGILTEGASNEDGILDYAIVGIGVNIKKGLLSPALSPIAASLEDFGIEVSAEELAITLAEEFFSSIDEIDSLAVMREYQEKSMLMGRRVKISDADGDNIYTVIGITDLGELALEDESGKRKNIISATVTLL